MSTLGLFVGGKTSYSSEQMAAADAPSSDSLLDEDMARLHGVWKPVLRVAMHKRSKQASQGRSDSRSELQDRHGQPQLLQRDAAEQGLAPQCHRQHEQDGTPTEVRARGADRSKAARHTAAVGVAAGVTAGAARKRANAHRR